jgi:ABC-type Mn2+/Zn2+ transport system ATPase subunit
MSSDQALLKIENMRVAYGPVLALQNVNLELTAGKLVGVIGPNGAGKSSLLKAILTIVPHQGRVLVAGQPVARVRSRLAYVPQRSEVRWDFPVTVADVVMMGRYGLIGWVRFPTKRDHEIVAEKLKLLELFDLRNRQISELSGGQQQRVFVARALAQAGDIILLDEPLTGVDGTSQAVIMQLLSSLRHEGKLIVMATHDLNSVVQECDECCCINHRLVAFGPPAQIFQPDILAATYGSQVLTMGAGSHTSLLVP